MKKITLHSATVRNDRSYADAGVTLAIGDKPDEITADCAKDLIDACTAVEASAKAETKAG